jgi:hypothetical protein
MKLEVTLKAAAFSFILDDSVEDCSECPSLPGEAGMAFNLHAATDDAAGHLSVCVEQFCEALRGRVEIFV